MDIADYIIELLQQHEVAVVPGLGSFHTSRVEGYYNKEQQLFYPPSLQAQFTKEEREGTDLVELIAERRQISLASARYFIEKFVTSLKEQVDTQSVPLGKMGAFITRRGELTFEPNSLNESYELYYGLAPEKLKRGSAFKQQAAEEAVPSKSPFFAKPMAPATPPPVEPVTPPVPVEEPAVIEEPAAIPLPEPHIATPPVHTVYTPSEENTEELAEETEEEYEKKGINIWLLLSIIIVFLGVGLIGLYKYKPELFSRFIASPPKPAAAKPLNKKSQTDSANAALQAQHDSASEKIDTTAPKQINPSTLPTTAAVDTFGVVIASLKNAKSAEIESRRYVKKGFSLAEVRKMPNSKMFCVNVGIYFNLDSANANRLKIIEERHLTVTELRIQKYPYKKP
jgi:outer membrane biosynthesis protein TonB